MVTAQDLLNTRYPSIDISEPVSKLITTLKRAKAHAAVVLKNGKYAGVISKRFLLSSRIQPAKMKVENAVKKRSKSKVQFNVPALAPNTRLKRMAALFADADTHLLPVVEQGKVIGVVHSTDVAKEVAKEYRGVACSELASENPYTVQEGDPFSKALHLFLWNGIDHLPVTDRKGTLTGIIALSDVFKRPDIWDLTGQHIPKAASHQGYSRSGYDSGEKTRMISLPIENFMTKSQLLCCTTPSTTIPNAVNEMNSKDAHNIILAKFNKPVGMFCIKDLLVDYRKFG